MVCFEPFLPDCHINTNKQSFFTMLGFRGILSSVRVNARPFSQSAVRTQEIIDFTRLSLLKRTKEADGLSRKDSSLSSMMQSPREAALHSKLTGIQAGRTVDVFTGNTAAAFQRLGAVVRANGIMRDKRSQRFYLKPGKAREMRRSRKHRKEFMKSFKHLIEVVKDAKRKGY